VRDKNWDRWVINGHFERKNNKITFSDRIVEGSGESKSSVIYKYRIEDDNKLILIVPDEGFKNDEKIYTKKKTTLVED
jgi:predicted metallo-beta-lactamase superfamily hydrolase